MTSFLLPVPTHTVGTDLITVQYDRQLIPYLTGLLRNDAEPYNFDPATGDTIAGAYYIQTLIDQLLTEVSMTDSDYEYTAYIPPWTWTPQGAYALDVLPATILNNREYMYIDPPAIGQALETYTKLDKYTEHFLWLPYISANNRGIMRILINGVILADIDMYSASVGYDHVFKSTGFLTPLGHCLVRLEMIGKNVLSSNYYMTLSALYIK